MKKTIIRKPPSDKKRYYVDKKQLFEEIIKYKTRLGKAREQNKPLPRASDYIGLAIMNICKGLSKDRHFNGYNQKWKEEMIYDAVENCVGALENFDPAKTQNAFGYFTQIAFNAFLRRIDREKRQEYVKHKYFQMLGLEQVLAADGELEMAIGDKPDDASMNVVASYEETLARRKLKKVNNEEGNSESAPSPHGRFGRGRKVVKPEVVDERTDGPGTTN